MNTKIKLGIIGTGQLAVNSRIPAFLANDNVSLESLVDLNIEKAKKIAKRYKIPKAYRSFDELIENEDMDAVNICTPPSTHSSLCIKALNNDIHVLCEKPIATIDEHGRRILDLSKKKNKLVMTSSYRRYVNNYRKAKENILQGKIGHPYCIEDIQLSHNPLYTWGKSPWYFKENGGGVISDLAPHSFDLLNYLFDDYPVAVTAQGISYFDSPVEDYCTVVFEYPDNKIGVSILSWLASFLVEITGIHGTVSSQYVSPKMSFAFNNTEIPELKIWKKISENLLNIKLTNLNLIKKNNNIGPLQQEVNQFVNKIIQDDVSFENSINALNVLMAINATKKSLKENKKIEIK